jgi:hypothetical protein
VLSRAKEQQNWPIVVPNIANISTAAKKIYMKPENPIMYLGTFKFMYIFP